MAKVNQATEDAFEHFLTIPWCAALIQEPGVTIFRHMPRGQADTARDKFSVKTLGKHSNCILHNLTFYKQRTRKPGDAPFRPFSSDAEIPEVTTLYDVADGATGWLDHVHGGLLAYLVDDAAGMLLTASTKLWDAWGYETHEVKGLTTELSIKYLTPTRVPSVIRCTTRYKEVRRRKIVLEVTMQNEKGEATAIGYMTWLVLDKSVEML